MRLYVVSEPFGQVSNRFKSALAYWYASIFNLSLERRLEAILVDLSERFGAQDKRGVIITPELSHGDLAQMIGSSRPMVSRLMGEMAAKRKIVRHGKQYILLEGYVPTKAALSNGVSLSNGRNGSHAVFANS
jgi:CRP-like cAMP-binding protein